MSDETKTKLEGDDEITLAMVNVWRSTMGRAPYTSSEWAKWPEERHPAMVALSWVRDNLVAPAVAEAKKRGMELSQETINVLQADRNKLRAWADEWNSKACELQHQLNLANDSLAAEKSRAENLAKGLREANRLGTDYVGEIRELRAKVAELEAKLAKPAPAALPKVGETVEVRPRGVPEFNRWERATVTDHGFVALIPDLLVVIRALGEEGKDWRRVQPQPSEPAPEAAPVEPDPSEPPSEDVATHPKRAICGHGRLDCEDCQWVGGFSKKYQQANKYRYAPTNERLRPAPIEPTYVPSDHEPPPEDVATPALCGLRRYSPSPDDDEDAVMLIDAKGRWLYANDVKQAYSRDLAAGIARETERLRKARAQLQEELRLADQQLSQLGDLARPHARQGENLIDAAFRLLKEDDDLRRQLREHAGECAACGRSLSGTGSYLRPDPVTRQNVRVCDECGGEKSPLEVDAAIVERRAGKCAVCGGGLQDRSSFPWKGVRVCGDCAQQSQSKLEAAIDARRAGK